MKKLLTIQLLFIVLFCCYSLVQAGSLSSTNYTVKRYVKPMGGNISDSANYNAKSTTGQDTTGSMSYGQYELEAGYWANANSNPFDITLSVSTVAENNVSGLSIATISLSDYDTADTHSYSLVSGEGDTDNSIFTINGSELIANEVFDYETNSSYSIRLRATDNNYGWSEKIIIIQIDDINEAPTVTTNISNQTVDEFSEFYLDLDSNIFNDTDTSDSLTYTATLSDGNPLPQWLSFNPDTLLFSGTPINDNIGTINIKVIATDTSSASVENTFSITINDTIENLPLISTNYRMPRYVLPMGGILSESTNFQKKASTGQDIIGLQTSSANKLKAGFWAKANSSPTQITISVSTVAENNVSGISIATISSLDYDASDSHSYSLVSGEGDTDNSIFTINGTELITNEVFDFETKTSYSIRIRATDSNYGYSEAIIIIQVSDINEAPDLSASISDQTINEDTSAGSITFTVTDAESSPCSMSLSITSSDQTLFPDNNLSYTCNENSYTITATPAANENGQATITLVVTDTGGLTATTSFNLTVTEINDSPFLSTISGQSTLEDTSISAINFTVTDAESDVSSLTVSALSSDLSLVAIGNITFSGTGTNKTISITPTANAFGFVTIIVSASDGSLTSTSAFQLTITSVNDLPTISSVSNQSINEDTVTGAISFTVADADASSLTVSGDSSNLALVPIENIEFGGTGSSRIIMITPTSNEYGSVSITINVSDGAYTASTTFELIVNPVNDSPTVVTNISNQDVDEFSEFYLNLDSSIFNDPDISDTLTYTATLSDGNPLPQWLSFNSSSLVLIGTPTKDNIGSIDIKIIATDTSSISVENTFSITINDIIENLPMLSTNYQMPSYVVPMGGIISESPNFQKKASTGQDVIGLQTITTKRLKAGYWAKANSNPTQITISLSTVAENNVSGLSIATISSIDYDANDSHSYSLVSGEGDTDNSVFTINGTGLIANEIFDYETKSSYSIRLRASDSNYGWSETIIIIQVGDINETPTISTSISDQTINEDTSAGSITYTVNDAESSPCSMSLSITSSDQTLFPDNNLSYTCNENSYTITATPSSNENGMATITILVTDTGGLTATTSFDLTVTAVNDSPVISTISDQTTLEDTSISALSFTVTDAETDAISLIVSALSSNLTLVAMNNIEISGTGSNKSISITPTANEFGSVTITISASDGALTSVTIFEVTVNSVNDSPTIVSNITNQSVDEYSNFILAVDSSLFADIDSGDSLTYTATLSDNNPLPEWLTFDPSTQTFTGTPPPDAVGTLDLKVTATDTSLASVDNTFSITINDTNSSGFPLRSQNYKTPRYVIPMTGNISTSTRYKHKTSSGQDIIGRMSKDLKTAKAGYWAKANSNPYDITLTSFTVAENNVSSITVGTLTSSDYDYSDPHTYSMVSGFGDTDNAIFILNGDTISTNEIFDYENKNSYSIRVRVNDSNYGWADKVLLVQVIDINELPDISATISDHTISEDTNAESITFTVTDPESAPCNMSLSITSSNEILFPSNSLSYTCNDNSYTITATPALNKYGLATITITIIDSGGLTATNSLDITVTSVDDSPVISTIDDQSTLEDTATGAISFTVTDVESVASSLTVSAISSDLTLVATENMSISGTGSAKTITITPTTNEFGSVTITMSVTDGNLTSSTSFALTVISVNDVPILSTILDQTTNEDTAINSISFSATDIEDAACSLGITITSSNQTILPDSNLSYTCNETNYTLTANPVLNHNGATFITVLVTDSGGLTAVTSFDLTITSVNDSPVISNISDQIIDEDCATSPISFTITDADYDSLTVSTTSSNLTLISVENIDISGTGANRTISMTPNLNKFGSSIITISVTDGSLTDTSNFNLTVNSVNDVPAISAFTSHTTNELTSFSINYTVTDIESTNLTVTAASSNSTLIPQNNLTITNTAENYTLSITPVMAETGTTSITITISDGENITETVFMLTVEEVFLQISGYVGYYLDPGNQPIPNVVLSLSGIFSYSAVTDSSGNYTLANVRPGSYTQTIDKSDITGGISINDAINILEAAVSLSSLSCEQIIAGDANMNDRITPLDAVKVNRYVAGMISNINNNNIRWRFIPELIADCSSWPPIPYSNISNLLITNDISGQDFIGILLGDVDGDWSP